MPVRLSDIEGKPGLYRLSDISEEQPKRLSDIEVTPKEREPTGLTHRPFANLRSMLQKSWLPTHKPEDIERVMERSKWEMGGLQQWTKGYWDLVKTPGFLSGKDTEAVKKFQKLERRLSEEKRNPIDALEKVGWAGMAIYFGAQAGQILEPAFVSAVAKLRPDLAKSEVISKVAGATEVATIPTPPSTDPIQRVMIALKEAKPIRGKQETLYTLERGKRLGQALAVGERIKGEKGFYAELGELKGEMPKVQFESIRNKVTQEDIDGLFINIKDSKLISDWDKIPARKGLAKLFGEFGGTVPTEGELSLLNKVFGKEFTSTVMEKRALLLKMKEAGYQLANIPRSIMASFDLSAPFRQGVFFIGRPKRFGGAFLKMFSQFGSDKAFISAQEAIAQRPTYGLMTESKLALTEMGKTLTTKEERFMSQWAERIPLIGRVVKASERAYIGFLNKLRADVFDDLIVKAERLGRNPKENMDLTKEIANFVNLGTGRGPVLGFQSLERASVALNSFFFSPRLMGSRLTLLYPGYYIKADPFVRKEALKSLFTFAGIGLTTLGLAKLGGAKVGGNLLSTDALKVKIGNTRIDPWGGFQQYIVMAARLITGQAVSSTTGKVMTLGEGYRALSRADIILRAIEYKTAPVFSFAWDLMRAQTFEGKPVKILPEIGKRFVPMAISDIYDIMNDDPDLLPISLLGVFGVGLQTYKQKPSAFKFKTSTRLGGGLKLRK